MIIPIELVGATSRGRSKFTNNQYTLNLYPENNDGKLILNSFPGTKAFFAGVATPDDRGAFEHLGVFYQVAAQTLYTVDQFGARTSRGTIAGTARCQFEGIGTNIVIVTNGTVYQWNGTTLSQITDSDLESPNSCTHINNQIVYDGNNGRWVSSDVGDASSINGLNYATAESHADDLVRVKAFNQILYLFGDKTTETWWNDGLGNPPFSRIEGGIMPIGLHALHSVANNDRFLYFLADDKTVYRIAGTNAQRISPTNISSEIQSFVIASDAEGHCFSFEGQNFYALTFPTANKTFCFAEDVNAWFCVSSDTSEGRFLASSFVRAFDKNFVTEHDTGNIYELDVDTYTEAGEEILRIRRTDEISGTQINQHGKRLRMNWLELTLETGVGLVSGQGENPYVALQISDDGGRTFSTEQWQPAGKSGEFIYRVRWHGLGSFYRRVLQFKFSDPVFWALNGCHADIEVGL